MQLRDFGRTGMRVSERSFGAWALGGRAYGPVERAESLRALARAEDLGCNLVDTAQVYGDSEDVLGEFLAGRRGRWLVATKYSGQPDGMQRTLEQQLARLRTDVVDFYMVHWMPGPGEAVLFEQLDALKRAGKIRAAGVSLKTARDIDRALAMPGLDGCMVRFSLLDPEPVLARLPALRARGPALLVRSALKEGFLSGKFGGDARFPAGDIRGELDVTRLRALVTEVERYRFLEQEAGTLVEAALRYVLGHAEVSSVVIGTKTTEQADRNFAGSAAPLSAASLRRIEELQRPVRTRRPLVRLRGWLQRLLGRD